VSVLEDVLVGHELGDRPLLADDELDNDESRLASMTASGDPSSSASSSSSAAGSMAGPAGKGAATVRGAGLLSSVALPFRRRSEERKEVKDKPNPLRLANDPDPANPQNRPAEDVFALAPFKLPPKVNLHSNRKKPYQLVEPYYQGLGSRFGSCLVVGRGEKWQLPF
jgi:hypothetical protein